MAQVSWMRPELRNLMAVYYKIRDVLEGAEAIKGRGSVGTTFISGINGNENLGGVRNMRDARRYLPQPNPHDTSPENAMRYRMYVERAMWYGATARTLDGLGGEVFQRAPQVTVPDKLQPLLSNVDGGSVTLNQQMARAVDYGIAYGRAGLLTDFPSTDGTVTQEAVNAGEAQPTVRLYAPWQIINWRVEQRGSKKMLTLVVLVDDFVYNVGDAFESVPIVQFRVLRIEPDGQHYVEIWQQTSATASMKKTTNYTMIDYYQPLDASGKPMSEIPFTFIGAKNNDEIPDKPPMQDLAEVNIGHYRNSAEYEDSVHLLGQPTPYASGLTNTWVKEIWGSKVIPLGSRAVIPLPKDGAMGLLQVAPNTLAHEAMLEKEHQMVMLGAKLMEEMKGNQTATGELIDETSETSVLSNVATNVAAAYKFAFIKAGLFVGEAIDPTSDDVKIVLNTSFSFSRMSAGDRQELVSEWQKGAISWTELRQGLRAAGIATQKDDEALAEIKKEQVEAIATGLAFGPAGVDLPPIAGAIKPPPANQAPNPVPPVKGAAKVPPSGKGAK